MHERVCQLMHECVGQLMHERVCQLMHERVCQLMHECAGQLRRKINLIARIWLRGNDSLSYAGTDVHRDRTAGRRVMLRGREGHEVDACGPEHVEFVRRAVLVNAAHRVGSIGSSVGESVS